MNRDLETLLDILQSAELARSYVVDVSREEFLADHRLQDAVIWRIGIIGEAMNRISIEMRGRHPSIEWSKIRGMRNRKIHEYEFVDMEVVWLTVNDHIPYLIEEVKSLISSR